MNLVDGKELSADLATPAIDRLNVDATVLLDKLANTASTVMAGFETVVLTALGNLKGQIAALDGWSVTVTIPPITFVLRKPQ